MNFLIRLKSLYKNEIIRRYVVINSFDGALTILGIILAEFFAGVRDPRFIVLPGLGATIAMGVSGMWGAYAAESSEVVRKTKEIEKHLLAKIRSSKFVKIGNHTALVVAIVDGLSPVIVSLLILIPFFLASLGVISVDTGYYISISVISATLFLLGMFTGVVARENMYIKGFKMLLAGLVIGLIFFALARFGLL